MSRFEGVRGGLLAIAGASALGQVVALAASPILSRQYTPTDFGAFSVAVAIVLSVGTVATLRLELAIPIADEEGAHGLVLLAAAAAAVVSGAGMLAVLLGGDRVVQLLHQPALGPWLWAVPVSALLFSLYAVLNQLAIRRKDFAAVGRRNLAQNCSTVLFQVGFGAVGLGAGGLISGFGAGQGVGVLALLRGSRLASPDARAGRSRHTLGAVARRYRRFPMVLAPAAVLNMAGLQLPVVLMSTFFGSQVAGWFGMSQRVLALPITLIGTAVAQVYLAELASIVRTDPVRCRRLFMRASVALAACAGLLAVILLLAGPTVFPLVFGEQWAMSGRYAQALAVALAGQLVAVPLSQTLIALERQGMQLAWDVLRVLVVVGAIWVPSRLGASALQAVWILAAASAVMYVVSWAMNFSAVHRAQLSVSP